MLQIIIGNVLSVKAVQSVMTILMKRKCCFVIFVTEGKFREGGTIIIRAILYLILLLFNQSLTFL